MPESSRPRVNYKTIALPASHGGWGFVFEPILLGLWVAPSGAGWWLSLAALGAFLSQQPLKISLQDWRRKRRYPRTVWANRFAAIYSAIALVAVAIAWRLTAQPFLFPLFIALPLAALQFGYDIQNRGRELWPELSGASSLGALVAMLALAAGWPLQQALLLWLILLGRTITSILYVRLKLRLNRGEPVNIKPLMGIHLSAILIFSLLAIRLLVPWLAVLALTILFGRALVGLVRHRPVAARRVGFQEMGYGLLTVGLTALGFLYHL